MLEAIEEYLKDKTIPTKIEIARRKMVKTATKKQRKWDKKKAKAMKRGIVLRTPSKSSSDESVSSATSSGDTEGKPPKRTKKARAASDSSSDHSKTKISSKSKKGKFLKKKVIENKGEPVISGFKDMKLDAKKPASWHFGNMVRPLPHE